MDGLQGQPVFTARSVSGGEGLEQGGRRGVGCGSHSLLVHICMTEAFPRSITFEFKTRVLLFLRNKSGKSYSCSAHTKVSMVQRFRARNLELPCLGFESQLSIWQMCSLRGVTEPPLPQLCPPCNRGGNSTRGWGEAQLGFLWFWGQSCVLVKPTGPCVVVTASK